MRDAAMAETLRRLALDAGAAILRVRARADLGARAKADLSPVTEADLAADAIIAAGLAAAYPEIPVVSEEQRDTWALGADRPHFLVDPLDGTREFISGGADFTVNIALIENGRPTAGVVYAPAEGGRLFRTAVGGGAVEERAPFAGDARPIHVATPDNAALRVVASRSHRDAATDAWLAGYAVADFAAAGSSLKFCLLAAGEADLYPRLGPTMEWDTAAGHAVLAAAGGHVLRHPDGAPLRYGAPGRANPSFIACVEGVALRLG